MIPLEGCRSSSRERRPRPPAPRRRDRAVGGLEDGDVVVVAQKAVSKVEGRVVRLGDVEPSRACRRARRARRRPAPRRGDPPREHGGRALAAAARDRGDAPRLRLRVGGRRRVEHAGGRTVVLLPLDPDASARRLRVRLGELSGAEVGVIVSDSFGRAWRQGTTDVALGVAGIAPLRDLRGTSDARGRELKTTQIAVADEIAGAAELVMGKARRVPAAIVRGVDVRGDGSAAELVMPRERDLFR